MNNINWEGAELHYTVNGTNYTLDLSDKQFFAIAKILGLKIQRSCVSCFSDETLDRLFKMTGNPLRLQEVD